MKQNTPGTTEEISNRLMVLEIGTKRNETVHHIICILKNNSKDSFVCSSRAFFLVFFFLQYTLSLDMMQPSTIKKES